MKLSRIQVSDFRKLTRVVINDLAPGLNVIVGDNEAGKSTLLAAMRAALFERHRVTGQVVEEMLPYGRQARPTVEMDFSTGGASYRLLKAFGSRPEARLVGAGGIEWIGDDADEELTRILGFTRPGRGESKPDQHHGAFGMMWVSQGTAHHTPIMDPVREQVASALEREVGEVAGGEHGRALLQLAADRQTVFWDKLRRPRGDYRQAIEELERLRAEREAVAGRVRELEAEVDRLGQVSARLESYAADDTVGRAREVADAANQHLLALGSLRQQVATATDAVKVAELSHREATRNVTTRRDAIDTLRQAASALDDEKQALQEARSHLERLQSVADKARDDATTALAAEHSNRQAVARLEARDRASRLRDGVAKNQQQLAAAEDLERKRLDAAAVIVAVKVDAGAMQVLESLNATIAEARVRLEAASVRLQLRPQFGGAAEIDGAILEEAELAISRDTTVHLFGFGEIDIRPGGGVAELERALRAAEAELADALAGLGQADLGAARSSSERHQAARQQLPMLTRSLAALAPAGLDRLRHELAVGTAELDQLVGDIGDVSAELLEAARREAGRSAEAAQQARGAHERSSHEANEAKALLAVATEREANARRLDKQARDTLAEVRLIATDAELQERGVVATTALERSRADLDAANAQLRVAEPELVQLRHHKALKALEEIIADIEGQKREQLQLEASLQAQGREGLGERLSSLEGEIAQRELQLDRQNVEARAAVLLNETLQQAQRETKERWLRPVQDRAAPYLSLLQPGIHVALDEDTFALDAVRRNGVTEPFAALSMGAREQIAVITRLALADILSDAGQTACLVLDDPLVNADESRLERMHLVLHKAAERHQVVVLTCRERDFLNLGAHLVRI